MQFGGDGPGYPLTTATREAINSHDWQPHYTQADLRDRLVCSCCGAQARPLRSGEGWAFYKPWRLDGGHFNRELPRCPGEWWRRRGTVTAEQDQARADWPPTTAGTPPDRAR